MNPREIKNSNQLIDLIDQVSGRHEHSHRRDRPYDGQRHTMLGERGMTEIRGITFRDLHDAFLRAAFLSSGDQNPASFQEARKGEDCVLTWADLEHIDLNKIDVAAWSQNLGIEIEKLMGIYPNIPKLTSIDPKDTIKR